MNEDEARPKWWPPVFIDENVPDNDFEDLLDAKSDYELWKDGKAVLLYAKNGKRK